VETVTIEVFDLETFNRIFSKNFTALLARSGVKGFELAKEIGVSQSSVSKWLNGVAFPDGKSIDKMRKRYGWTTDDMLSERTNNTDTIEKETLIISIADHLGFERPKLKKKPK